MPSALTRIALPALLAAMLAMVGAASSFAARAATPARVKDCLERQKILATEQPVKPYAYERRALSVLDVSFVMLGDKSTTIDRVAIYRTPVDAARALETLRAGTKSVTPSEFRRRVSLRDSAILISSAALVGKQRLVLACLN